MLHTLLGFKLGEFSHTNNLSNKDSYIHMNTKLSYKSSQKSIFLQLGGAAQLVGGAHFTIESDVKHHMQNVK